MYGKNVGPDLAARVAEETAFFHLPPDWREGREVVEGYAIDEKRTTKIDDALLATSHPDGSYTLPVSIADAGSFLAPPSAIRSLARIRGQSWVDNSGQSYPLWPHEITQHYLSFKEGVERPALTVRLPLSAEGEPGEPIFTKSIIKVKAYSHAYFNTALQAEAPQHPAFADMYAAAKKLQAYREEHFGRSDDLLFPPETPPSMLVLGEAMFAMQRAAGRFVLQNSIPAIYRMPKARSREAALYSAQPDQHDAADPYVRISSPLWRFADFVSQANIIAHLDGRPFPFDDDAVASIVDQYNARRQKARIPSAVKAQGVHESIRNGTASLKDIMTALEIPETIGGSAKIRQEAFEYIIAKPQTIRPLLKMFASTDGYFLRARRKDDPAETSRVMQAKDGTVYPYPPFADKVNSLSSARQRVRQQRTDAQTLARIARLGDMPELPWYLSEDEAPEVILAPAKLKVAAKKLGIKLKYEHSQTPDGQVCIKASATKGDEQYHVEAIENTEELARSKAAHLLYNAHPMLAEQEAPLQTTDATDDERKNMKALTALDAKDGHGARHYLMAHLQKADAAAVAPEYIIVENTEPGQPTHTCTLKITHEGTEHTVTATTNGGSLKKLKDLAAYRALKTLGAPVLERLPIE